VLPRPPWFVTHRRAAEVAARLVAFERDHSPRHLPGLFAAALRG
jgi:aldehyde dehydrogenase (NAD(P)+)